MAEVVTGQSTRLASTRPARTSWSAEASVAPGTSLIVEFGSVLCSHSEPAEPVDVMIVNFGSLKSASVLALAALGLSDLKYICSLSCSDDWVKSMTFDRAS